MSDGPGEAKIETEAKRPAPRLSFVFASQAPVAVILRRGPSDWVEMIRWDTQRDVFDRGQWLHGRVFGERCGLSPDGTLLVYFAARDGRVDRANGYTDNYTAVSKPPYFTALALWPERSSWGGGGRFVDARTLRLGYGGARSPEDASNARGHRRAAAHRGSREKAWCVPAPHPKHLPQGLKIEGGFDRYDSDADFHDAEFVEGTQWSGRDHAGRRIVARDGSVFAADEKRGHRVLIALSEDAPRNVAPPEWATRW